MAENIVSMHGVVVGMEEDGSRIANMVHPERIEGVVLPQEALCLTRSYPNPGSRTRITGLHTPDLEVREGSPVVAHVEVERQYTGRVLNPNRFGWNQPYYIDEHKAVGGVAVKWGLRLKS